MAWSYNEVNNEDWNKGIFDTREEALKEGLEYAKECGWNELVIGELEELPLPDYIDVEGLLEQLEDQYSCEISEYDGDLYGDVSKDNLEWLQSQLNDLLEQFHNKAEVKSTWFRVISEETFIVSKGESHV